MNIKEIIENPHVIHKQYCSVWDFYLQSYEGGIDYSGAFVTKSSAQSNMFDNLFRYFVNGKQQDTRVPIGNLFMHPKERTEDFARRIHMSYFYNFCAPIIDIYSDHLFKQQVVVDFAEIQDSVEAVEDNIDMQGNSIDEFRKNMADMAQVYGHVFVVVDSPKIDAELNSRQDQIEKRAFPYLSMYSPQNVLNWALDEFGSPYWVLVRETYDGNKDVATFNAEKNKDIKYRLWTRTGWFVADGEYNVVESGEHDLGEVPIVCVYAKKSKKARGFLGVSDVADIAFVNRDIYNASSELRQILRDQTFSFLALQGNSDEYPAVDLGTGKGILYPEGRNVPQYVSPPSDNANIYFDHIDRQVAKIYQLAKLSAGGASTQTKATPVAQDGTSGVSKAWDFNQTNSALNTKSSSLEEAEEKIWRLFAKWLGIEWTGDVEYPNEFSVSSLVDDLNEAEQEARVGLGKTFNLEVRKAIIKKKFPNMAENEVEAMVSEIKQEQGVKAEPTSIADRLKLIRSTTATGGQKQGETK